MKKAIRGAMTELRRLGRVRRAITKASLVSLTTFSGTLAFMAVIFCAPAFAQNPPPGMSPQVLQQIQAIAGEKAQRTDAQKKIDSALLYAARAANGEPQFPNAPGLSFPQLSATNLVGPDGRVLVDIATTDASGLAGPIQSLGGSVISSFPPYNTVRASLPVTALESLAAIPSVKSIRPADVARTNRILPPQGSSPKSRLGIVRDQLGKVLGGNNQGAQTNVGFGTTISQAVVAHGADIVQNSGVTGAGIKICVLSDGVNSLASRQTAGELPAVQVLSGQAGSGDEGTAMLELVADMAPGASLGFATGFGSVASMATNIINLRNTLGCNIIVDDVTYFAEAAFQEDTIANAVTTVVNAGAMYFSSAANSGHLTGGNSGTWEGDFANGGAATGVLAGAGTVHNFGAALFDTLTASSNVVSLKWSDPAGASGNDYDLYVLNSTGTALIGGSTGSQTGTQNPYEATNCGSSCPSGAKIYVVLFSGVARALRVDTNRGRLSIGTNGSTFGHNGGVNTITVAAVSNSFSPISGRQFLASDTVATYSSDGPRKLFLNPVPATTPITAGCYLYACGGGTLLPKVDIAAADCDTTTTPGFTSFCGTSAAAPQAAAIAALVKSAYPALSNTAVLAKMKTTAIDIMAAGTDVDSGAGIVMADKAVTGTPSCTSSVVAIHDFNADGCSDILWHQSGGGVGIWLMSGTYVVGSATVGTVDTAWQIAGTSSLVQSTGDFDGDGKADMLWRKSDGTLAMWLMNGTVPKAQAGIGVVDTAWQIAGSGDFDGNGKADILWRKSDGTVALWLMNGATPTTQVAFGAIDTTWQIAGIGDFDGDGKADILWRKSDGTVAMWLMNGITTKAQVAIGSVDTAWQIVGVADFDGDSKADILWRHANGSLAIWEMNGITPKVQVALGSVGTSWQIVSTGDYDGDGKGDILWRNTDGTVRDLADERDNT